jgi:trans-2,3-dihydro-3-hydroxyanthranilate isomerase
VASAISLDPDAIATAVHAPLVASVGLGFVFAELVDREALARARIHIGGFEALAAAGGPPDIHLYARSCDDFDLRARMFAPLDGVPDDPATGSAGCALAGLLAYLDPARSGSFRWRIAQGVEMGRPSVLEARAETREGSVVGTWVGGASVLVGDGFLEVDE